MSTPKKLIKFLETLTPHERAEKLQLFEEIVILAKKNGLQSPHFWASRQIINGRTRGQIDHDIERRRRRIPSLD